MKDEHQVARATQEMADRLNAATNQRELVRIFFDGYLSQSEDAMNSFASTVEITERSIEITPNGAIQIHGGSIRLELTPIED